MKILISKRKRYLFFRTEIAASITELPEQALKELGSFAVKLLSRELPQVQGSSLRALEGTVLTNIRGRPELDAGGESAEETVFLLEGSVPKLPEDQSDRAPFRIALTTRFLDFQGRDIRYTVRLRVSSGFELAEQSMLQLFQSPQLELHRLQLALDYFQPRRFSFLGILLPELRERFSFQSGEQGGEGVLKFEELDFQGDFSGILSEKITLCEPYFELPFQEQLKKALLPT